MTEPLFRNDAYLKSADAEVIEAAPGRIVLSASLFYPRGGGQPGDKGELRTSGGTVIPIVDAVYDADRKTIALVPAEGAALPQAGESVTMVLNWDTRFKRMRAHTALHLLSVVLPFPVTGGSVGDAEGRLDFDSGDVAFNKEEIEQRINELVATDAPVSTRWIADAELEANPQLVKTMMVKPPMGQGRIRLVEIAGLDLQPCGGTHVGKLSEIGHISVKAIEKKGKINRRVRIALEESGSSGGTT